MSQTDERAFDTMERPPRRRSRGAPTAFEKWAWSQVLSYQIGLTASYIASVYFGVASIVATVPAFQVAAPEGYAIWWAVALTVGGAVGAIGSVSRLKLFERAELVGASLVGLTIGSYALILHVLAYGLGNAERVSGAAGFVALAIPFLVRTLWLASQVLRK